MFAKTSYPIGRSETVAVRILNPNNRQFKFSDSETTLANRKFIGIVVHSEALVKTIDNDVVVPNALQKKAYITLANRSNEQHIVRMPLELFFNANASIMLELKGLDIDLRKSFIDMPDNVGLTADMAFVITFFYE